MPPKKTSSTKKRANPQMETPVINFVMCTCSGAPINQRMTLPPAKKIKPTPLPRGNLFMSFDDYSAILARHAKSSVATTEPPTDTESDTQDHPKTDDPVTDDEDNSEGQADAHKGNLVDDPKIREGSDEDDEYTEDQDADEENKEEDDDNDNEIPAPPSKVKLPKKCVPPKALPPKFTVTETPPSTQILQAAAHVTTKSVEKSAVSSALPKSSMAMETDDDNDLPVTSRPGQLCQEGIDDVQELGRKTLHAAKIIGDKYGKSARTILIEAGLSVKHSRAETPWNMHQGWYKGKYPQETNEELGDWRKRQRDHYYSLQDSDPLIVMSTRDALAKRASGFVAGSSTFMDLINERQVDAQLALDWIITAAKAKNYQLAMLRFGGAYDILFSKPEQFGYKTKSVQWRKLLDVAYQNKFQFELWPDEVPPVGPDFNYHTLSAQHLKLLIVPYIKRRASQYYDAELKTEAENLLELRHKQGHSDKTLDDIIDELDVAVSEIEIVPWLKDHIEQCEKDDPKMFDIPLVTSASHIVLRKLGDSEKFKHSILKGLLQSTRKQHQYVVQMSALLQEEGSLKILLRIAGLNNRPPLLVNIRLFMRTTTLMMTLTSRRSQRSYVIVMVRRMLNCHLRTLSLLILDLDFNLDLALVHLHLTTNHLNTGMMRYSRCLRVIFIPMGIMLPIITTMIFQLQALREWLQGHMRDPIMAGTLRLLVAGSSQGSIDAGQPSVYVICGGPAQGSYWADPYIYCPLNIEQIRRQEQEGSVIWSHTSGCRLKSGDGLKPNGI
ncbi:hypothetical protein F4604DRAFT_1687958 [Suillus subluteus]|nr:hypothetical protein F4604DRAFT_1687958 [Suillus subluteus]